MAFARINPHLFTTTRAGKAEIDVEFNIQTSWANILDQRIDDVESQGIAGTTDPANIGKLPVTDGFNISWVKLNLDYLQPNSFNGTIFQNASIPQRVLENASVGTDQVIDLNITAQKIAEGAVIPSKIPVGSLPFSKFVKPQTASVIGGTTTGGGSWYELTLGDYQVVTKKPQNNGVTGVSLSEVWTGTNGTFDGSKITASTLVLSKLISAQQSSLIAGTPTNNAYYEVPMGDWQIAVKRAQDNAPTARTLDVIWANTANSFNGAQITNNSLPGNKILDNSIGSSKLNNAGQMIPFSMAYVLGDGTIQKSLNVQWVNKTRTGTYQIKFNSSANDNKYIVVFGAQGSNAYYLTAEVAQNSATTNGFTVNTGYNQSTVDGEFYFVVYAF